MLSDHDEVIWPEITARTATAMQKGRGVSGAATTEPWIGQRGPRIGIAPIAARSFLLLSIGSGVAIGLLATGPTAESGAVLAAGTDLTRLLRAMAAIKTFMAAGAATGVLWRFGVEVSPMWLTAYAFACGAMAAGPVLIWTMVHVGAGALLLHGGLLATLLLLWRDPIIGRRLAAVIAARRVRLR